MPNDPDRGGATFTELVAIMRRLLAPDGCPWDREQTLATLTPYLVEETYEVLEAIEEGDPREHCEELGDLLLQIVFHAELRRAEGAFAIDDVVDAIRGKLVRRHPHVFGELAVSGTEEVLANWAVIKAEERKAKGQKAGALAGVPRALPALLRASRLGEKAAAVGFDWPSAEGPRAKVDEELAELDEALASGDDAAIERELGDLLFAAVNLARHRKVDAEAALRGTIGRFIARFERIEARLGAEGRAPRDASLEELDALWDEAKRGGGAAG